jgi:PAS domain S-box-containing protein
LIKAGYAPLELSVLWSGRFLHRVASGVIAIVMLLGFLGLVESFYLPQAIVAQWGGQHFYSISPPTAIAIFLIGLAMLSIQQLNGFYAPRKATLRVWFLVVGVCLISLYYLFFVLAQNGFSLWEALTQPLYPHSISFLSVINLLLCSIALGVYAGWKHSDNILAYGVGIPCLLVLNISIFIILGFFLNLPILYDYTMSPMAAISFIFIALGLLTMSLPTRGLLLPLISRSVLTRSMALLGLFLGLAIMFNEAFGVSELLKNRALMGSELERQAFRQGYIRFEFLSVLLSVLVMTLALRAIQYYNNADQNDQRVRRLIDSNITGVFFWHQDGRILGCNDAFLQLLGYSREEFERYSLTWWKITPPRFYSEDLAKLKEILTRGVITPYEKQYLRKEGGVVDVLVGAATLDDKLEQGVAFVIDITYLKHLEAELNMAKDEAEIANQNKSQFLANMSHELRTPLNAVIGFSEMMEGGMGGDLTDKQRKYMSNIVKSARHLLILINDILDLSKIEAGQFDLAVEWLEPTVFLNSIQETFMELALQKDIHLHFYVDPALKGMEVDPLRLKQIFFNLISNAIKFNVKGGAVFVRFRLSEDGRCVVGEVEDTGIGIAQEKISELFTEFHQIDNSYARHYEGTGLGLALTRKLVELHGGTITVQSQEHVGSLFRFVLPMTRLSTQDFCVSNRKLPL